MACNQASMESKLLGKNASPTMSIILNRDLGKYENNNVRGLENLFLAWLWQNIRYKCENSHIVGTDKGMMPPIEFLKC